MTLTQGWGAWKQCRGVKWKDALAWKNGAERPSREEGQRCQHSKDGQETGEKGWAEAAVAWFPIKLKKVVETLRKSPESREGDSHPTTVMIPFSAQLACPQARFPIKPIRDVSHEVFGVANHKEHSERAAFLGPLTQLIEGRAFGSCPAFEGWFT
ncbi:MAG: hypothetical protein FRX49_10036 [Trebouxia sp. A1-2]|nr:MAG: hypothetical protein FRX49_10036 [Trebouxia sp. A1-2]